MSLLTSNAQDPNVLADKDSEVPATPGHPGVGGAASAAAAAEGFVPDQSRAERPRSCLVDDFAVPHGREEEWRFTPVDRLTALFQVQPSVDGAIAVEGPAGVTHEQVAPDAVGVLVPADRAAVVAWAGAELAERVGIAAEAELDEPVRVTVQGSGSGRLNTHLVIDAGAHSRATVVLTHQGLAECGENVEIRAGDGSQLTVVTVQEWDDASLHLGQHDVLVGRDATVRHIAVTLGGGIVRLSTNARYAGPGGTFEGLGVYFADAGQHLEHRLFVDHEAAHCVSNVEYKGALQGDTAHSVWVGDVLIRAAAEGTDTYELNRNLVLTPGARADSVPNLEIETGDIVGAGHASATGRFDDEQLFYLQARGIPEDAARRLVVRGFFAGIIQRIGIPEVQERLMAAVDAELEGGR